MSEVAEPPLQVRRAQIMRTDWFAIITELQTKHDIPMLRIGQRMGFASISEAALRKYRAGAEPLHWRGEALLTLWAEVTGKRVDARPMTEYPTGYRAIGRGIRPSHPVMTTARLVEIRDSRPETATPTLASRRKPGRPKKEQTA